MRPFLEPDSDSRMQEKLFHIYTQALEEMFVPADRSYIFNINI